MLPLLCTCVWGGWDGGVGKWMVVVKTKNRGRMHCNYRVWLID